jgi:hypothetical protein
VNIWTGKGNGQAVSDKDGKFVVESVPKGPWDVYAWAVGYANTRLSKQLPNSDAGLRIVLKREGVLKGTVIDEATKKPVEKFRAYLHSEDGRPGGGGWRQPRWSGNDGDPEGKFQIQAPPGTYRLEIVAQGYVRGKKDGIVIQAGTDPEPVKMELKRGGAIEGIVRAENGQPAPWVQVYVGRDDGSGAFSSHGFSENDGYFFVGDLDSGTYTAMFQQHEAPLLIQSGVFVGGDRPAFLDAQIQTVAVVTFDFVLERPKPAEDASKSGETVAGATSGTPPPKPWRPPRVRVWVESQDGTILGINHEWTGPDQQKFRPLTRKDLFVPQRKEKFSVGAKDLPAGRFVLRASAKGFVDVRMPFQVQQSVRWRMPVEMKLLPREQRPDTPDGPRLRTGFWIDQDGNRMEYRYYEDE